MRETCTQSYLLGRFLLWDDGQSAVALDSLLGHRVVLRGIARSELLAPTFAPSRGFLTMASLDLALGGLCDARRKRGLLPLERGALLRGDGYSTLFLELTSRCNERCSHCYAEASPERTETLPPSVLDDVLVDARALGFTRVQLTGGDPLTSPHCAYAARRVRKLGFDTLEVYTNGLALRGELYESLRALGPRFAFSFYSHDAAIHDAITQTEGSQARTLDAIERCLTDGLDVRVSVIVMTANLSGVSETLAFLRRRGVTRLAVDVQRGVGRGTFSDLQLDLTENPHAHGAPEEAHLDGRIAVAANGDVFPCIFSRHICLGNLRRTSLSAILNTHVPIQPDFDRLEHDCTELNARLACRQCQIRGALLASGERLLQLRGSP